MFQKLFTAKQIKEIDQQTIIRQGITSEKLMERAANRLYKHLLKQVDKSQDIFIFCGKGNNGGDALVLSRLFFKDHYNVHCLIVPFSSKGSIDFEINFKKLQKLKVQIREFSTNHLPEINKNDVIIDGIFGTGLSRPAEGISKEAIGFINRSKAKVYSVDIPSGLYADRSNAKNDSIVHADLVFSFQFPKISFFFPENAPYVNDYEVVDIGLDQNLIQEMPTQYLMLTDGVKDIIKKPLKNSYKNTFGHALIIGGSKGMIGAPVLASKAALRIGAGLVSNFLPKCGYQISQTYVPEVMTLTDKHVKHITHITIPDNVSAVGIGPGIGQHKKTQIALKKVLKKCRKPLLLDADALNFLSKHRKYLKYLSKNTILTPHIGEFRRLAGTWNNDEERLKKLKKFAKKYQIIVVLKGAYTTISDGDYYYINPVANPALATAGSGDVLSGIITGLLAQQYQALEAALLGVYLHSQTAENYVRKYNAFSMTAGEIINELKEI